MPTVHAYRRTKSCEVEIDGEVVKFAPNDQGHVVAQVKPGRALDRLMKIAEGYRVYGAAQADEPDEDGGEDDGSRYVLTDGEEQVDLRAMNDEQLHAFARENEVKVHPNAKGDTIRNKIVEHLNGA